MMPGNNEASDNAARSAQDDAVLDTASARSTDGTQAEASVEPAGGEGDTAGESVLHDNASVVNLDEATASASDDPLGFGDQRMGTADDEPMDGPGQLQAKLAEAEARAADYWDRLVRLQAEMENQRKRAQNDVTKARKFALEGIVGDLLPVKDSLEMGLAAAQAEDADPQAIVEGADLTLKMLSQVFEKNNIAEINPVDEKFDPEYHQAMSMQEIEGKPANTVASVMQKGYTLNERLVRPALVMVAK